MKYYNFTGWLSNSNDNLFFSFILSLDESIQIIWNSLRRNLPIMIAQKHLDITHSYVNWGWVDSR